MQLAISLAGFKKGSDQFVEVMEIIATGSPWIITTTETGTFTAKSLSDLCLFFVFVFVTPVK